MSEATVEGSNDLQAPITTTSKDDETMTKKQNSLSETSLSSGTTTSEEGGNDDMNAVTTGSTNNDSDIAAAAVAEEEKEPTTIREFTRALNKLEVSGKNVMKTTLDTMRSAEGKDHKGDVYADTFPQGLELLERMVKDGIEKVGGLKTKKGKKWTFDTCPNEEFGKTPQDVYMAFLRWAVVEGSSNGGGGGGGDDEKKAAAAAEEEESRTSGSEEEAKNESAGVAAAVEQTSEEEGGGGGKAMLINVSKAYRRLDSYVTWMDGTGTDLIDPPLTSDSVKHAWEIWQMKLTYDSQNRLIWWFDVGALDSKAVKSLTNAESLRLFVWFAHLVMFDDKAQKYGMIFVENFAKMGFWSSMTMMPMKLGMKLDKLTIGVLPVKMNELLILESPLWCDIMMGMMNPFLSKKMKRRIKIVKKNEDQSVVVMERVGGKEFIPMGFADCDGTLEKDLVAQRYFGGDGGDGKNE